MLRMVMGDKLFLAPIGDNPQASHFSAVDMNKT